MKCLIKINDKHIADNEEDKSELMTFGTIEGTNNNYTIKYTEQSEEMKDCVTTLNYQPDIITMRRSGNFNSELIIENGVRHICCYSTPEGDISIGIFAHIVKSDIDINSGGTLKFLYDLDFNSGFVGKTELNITVKII